MSQTLNRRVPGGLGTPDLQKVAEVGSEGSLELQALQSCSGRAYLSLFPFKVSPMQTYRLFSLVFQEPSW